MAAMKIVLATLHSRYIHASLALPCLAAVCSGAHGIETVIREFTVNEPQTQVLRSLAAEQADLVAFSCYIWNVEAVSRLASDLKKVRPDTVIVAGGPEVSFVAEEFLGLNPAFDCVIRGEGEKTWLELVLALQGDGSLPGFPEPMPAGVTYRSGKTVFSTPDREPISGMDEIPSPFAMGLVDTAKPLVYYETSRGCPFSCAFCLSSMEKEVRSFSLDRIRADLTLLMESRVSTVKLVDRTFNYDAERADEIWDFIIARNKTSRFHFEIAADLLTESNLRTLGRAPAGMFRFEIGVQATGRETLARVGRKSDTERIFANVKRLLEETGVTVHMDLVAGLPGEGFAGFLGSLGRLFQARPHHIQVEPLKVLKGSPMVEIALQEGYVYSESPPYTILSTPHLSFVESIRIEDISRLLDLYYNSGRFNHSLTVAGRHRSLSAFFNDMAGFLEKNRGIVPASLKGLFELIWSFARVHPDAMDIDEFRDALRYDFCLVERPSSGSLPSFFNDLQKNAPRKIPKETLDSVLERIEKPPGCRVRTFAEKFLTDYSVVPPGQGPADLIITYVAVPGKGLTVKVFNPASQAFQSNTPLTT